MNSRDLAAMRGTRPLLRLQFQCPGEPCPPELWAPCRALATACSHRGCSASWAVSLLVNPDWKVFLSLCIMNLNLLKIIVNAVYGEGSQQLWGCSVREFWNVLWSAGSEAKPVDQITFLSYLVWWCPLCQADTRMTLDLEIKLQIYMNSLYKRNGTMKSCLSYQEGTCGALQKQGYQAPSASGLLCWSQPQQTVNGLGFPAKGGVTGGPHGHTVLKIRTTHFAGFKWMKINSPTPPP